MNNMNKTFSLKIVSPSKVEYEGDNVTYLKVRTENGDLGILPNHSNLMCLLGDGMMILRTLDKEDSYFVSGGFLEVSNNFVTLLAEDIMLAENEEEVRKIKKETLERAIEEKRREDQNILGTRKKLQDSLLR